MIVKVDIDRMTHGKELMARFVPMPSWRHSLVRRPGRQGQAAGNCRRPRGQYRLPVKPEEIDHFMAMITTQSRRIEPAQLDQLRQSLKEAAEKIEQEQNARRAERAAAPR